ncbi:MAG: molybdopterin-dependent oxidoreductase, partial [Chloroflexi bacterium]|nr:molybdopterin-dependent oxidoreductase [Chloroflexota bacterium]
NLPQGSLAPHAEQGIDMWALSRLVMARDKALFSGHPVAAVAALDPFTAEEAIRLIEVEYELLPPVMDVLEAMRKEAPLLHPDLYTQEVMGETDETPSNIASVIKYERGNIEAGFAEAEVVMQNTFRTQMVHQGYLEPVAAVAAVDTDGNVTVWTSSQGYFTVKNQLSVLLGIPSNKIRVIPMEIGGGFGGKLWPWVDGICILLSKTTGRPVKIVLSRDEVLRATGPGSPSAITIKMGATRSGALTALEATLIYDAGAFPGSPVSFGCIMGFAPYRFPHFKITGYDVVTNSPRVAAYRAPGGTQIAYAVEQQMDMIAEALHLDPLNFRLKNAAGQGDRLTNEMPLTRVGIKTVLEQSKNHPSYTSRLKGRNRGRGVACGFWRGATNTSSCHISLNADGTLELVLGSVDLTGTRTTMAQIAAEEFGIPIEEVHAVMGDTSTAIPTDVTGGSRITYTMSNAVHRACQDVLSQLKQRATATLKSNPEDIEYASKRFWVRGAPEKSVSLGELTMAAVKGAGPIIGKGSISRMLHAPSFGVHIADVELDKDTGKVKLLNYTVIQDAGLAVNPTQVEGQMQGGSTQGIGWALWEEYIFKNGILQNASLLDYRMPTALDVPFINTQIVEVPATDGRFGIRGAGENSIVAPPAAIANAIYNACGVRLRELPMSPERILWALRKAEENPPPSSRVHI